MWKSVSTKAALFILILFAFGLCHSPVGQTADRWQIQLWAPPQAYGTWQTVVNMLGKQRVKCSETESTGSVPVVYQIRYYKGERTGLEIESYVEGKWINAYQKVEIRAKSTGVTGNGVKLLCEY